MRQLENKAMCKYKGCSKSELAEALKEKRLLDAEVRGKCKSAGWQFNRTFLPENMHEYLPKKRPDMPFVKDTLPTPGI